jgi:hypothetical protein
VAWQEIGFAEWRPVSCHEEWLVHTACGGGEMFGASLPFAQETEEFFL